jgi:hypothetical protein
MEKEKEPILKAYGEWRKTNACWYVEGLYSEYIKTNKRISFIKFVKDDIQKVQWDNPKNCRIVAKKYVKTWLAEKRKIWLSERRKKLIT